MLVLTAVTFASDKRYVMSLTARLRTSKFGFRVEPNGAWTWHVSQQPPPDTLGGDAVLAGHFKDGFADLCKAIGAPAVRIRAAIPEEVLPGSLGARRSRVPRPCVSGRSPLAIPEGRLQQPTGSIPPLLPLPPRAVNSLGRTVGISAVDVMSAHDDMKRNITHLRPRNTAQARRLAPGLASCQSFYSGSTADCQNKCFFRLLTSG